MHVSRASYTVQFCKNEFLAHNLIWKGYIRENTLYDKTHSIQKFISNKNELNYYR